MNLKGLLSGLAPYWIPSLTASPDGSGLQSESINPLNGKMGRSFTPGMENSSLNGGTFHRPFFSYFFLSFRIFKIKKLHMIRTLSCWSVACCPADVSSLNIGMSGSFTSALKSCLLSMESTRCDLISEAGLPTGPNNPEASSSPLKEG